MTIKALLELKNLLLWEFKSFFFSGYTIRKAIQGSARDKCIGRYLDTRAVGKNWQWWKEVLVDLKTMPYITTVITGSILPGEKASLPKGELSAGPETSLSPSTPGWAQLIILTRVHSYPLRLLFSRNQSCQHNSVASVREASLKPPQSGDRNYIKNVYLQRVNDFCGC